MFRSNFEKNLDNATSHLQLEPDWPSILTICDEINQKDVNAKSAFAAIKKKMNSQNPHSAYYALLVLESVVKNCGSPIQDEVFTKENCEMFSNFLEQTPHANVREKMLELVQTWAYAFRSVDKYQAIKDTMTILKAKGHKFPELKEADAMFKADIAPQWKDGRKCHRCRIEFTLTNRKHHCRNCGQCFCGQCTTKQCPLPKFGIEKDVRVCDTCYNSLKQTTKPVARSVESDLPAEYLNSSLAQQVQTPPSKSEQELKEEEELQLALALSQSEAESKKQLQQQQSLAAAAYRYQQRSPSPDAPPAPKDFQAGEEISNPDLAKYLNRSYWEQRKVNESPMASPSAPSPMPPTPQPQDKLTPGQDKTADEKQLDAFASHLKGEVEIFVNRMKSNSSRGRSIANDTFVQSLFMNLTAQHSQLLLYIKELDDKRMFYEQLQDKLVQIKDSRAALDMLRQEHQEKLRLIAEEQERQRQIQMAQKLEIMRKKKQEYLQYQRQMALQRIQEQEREMQLRQEQQKAQYLMGQSTYPFIPPGMVLSGVAGSPLHRLDTRYNSPYSYNPNAPISGQFQQQQQQAVSGASSMPAEMYGQTGMQQQQPPHIMMHAGHGPMPGGVMAPGMIPTNGGPHMMPGGMAHNLHQQQQQHQMPAENGQMSNQQAGNISQGGMPSQAPIAGQQQGQEQLQQQLQAPPPPHGHQHQQPPQLAHVMLQQQQGVIHTHPPIPTPAQMPGPAMPQQQQQQVQPIPQQQQQQVVPPQSAEMGNAQIQAVAAAPAPPKVEPEQPAAKAAEEPPTAELISFD